MDDAERTALLTEIDHLRDLLVFADGCVLAHNMRYGDYDFVLADLYAEDCEWAQQTLANAGCHERGAFLDRAPIDASAVTAPRTLRPDGSVS